MESPVMVARGAAPGTIVRMERKMMNNAGTLALNQIRENCRVVVRSLGGGRRQCQRLLAMGVARGIQLKVVHNRLGSQDALLIDIEGSKLIIPRHIAANIFVENE